MLDLSGRGGCDAGNNRQGFVDRASHETTSATMVRTDGDFDSGDSDYTWLERDDFSSKRHHAQN